MTSAIILNEKGNTYVSPIFAIKYDGLESQMVGFDESYNKIKLIKMWGNDSDATCRNVFIVENDFDTNGDSWVGFEWVINDKKLFDMLLSVGSVKIDDFPLFEIYRKKIILPDTFEIKTQKDINALMDVSFGFHDSSICEYAENENTITVRFDTTWGCYITVIFEGVIAEEFKERVGLILYSEIVKTADGFSFTVKEGYPGWIDRCDYAGYADFGEPYIKCKKIHWQIEVVYE